MVAPDNEDKDASLVQAPELFSQESSRLHRSLLAVVEIAGEQERINLLLEAEIDDPYEGVPSGVADQFRQAGIPQRKGTQRGV